MNELDPKSNHTHKSDETLHGAPSMLSSRFLNRKKYNVISEEVRKRIIKKLTIENANIKDVAKEFNLKLSTCKAILQVYLKEGRIGKKTTRDRKSKIINTLIITTINPLNPLQSTIKPYVAVSEAKFTSKEESVSDLTKEAMKKASEHMQNIFSNNVNEIYNIQIPQNQQKMLLQTLMQSQLQAIAAILLKNANQQQSQSNTQSPQNDYIHQQSQNCCSTTQSQSPLQPVLSVPEINQNRQLEDKGSSEIISKRLFTIGEGNSAFSRISSPSLVQKQEENQSH